MGDRHGLSPRARAFSVAALLQLTDGAAPRDQRQHSHVTGSDAHPAATAAEDGRCGAAASDVVQSIHQDSPPHDPATDRLASPTSPGGESDPAQTSQGHRSRDAPRQVTGPPEATDQITSPPHWMDITRPVGRQTQASASSGHLPDGTGSLGHLAEVIGSAAPATEVRSSAGHAAQGLTFPRYTSVGRSSGSITANNTAPVTTQNSSSLHNIGTSTSLLMDTGPTSNPATETGPAPDPAAETDEQGSDSGTASGDEDDSEDPPAPQDRLAHSAPAPVLGSRQHCGPISTVSGCLASVSPAPVCPPGVSTPPGCQMKAETPRLAELQSRLQSPHQRPLTPADSTDRLSSEPAHAEVSFGRPRGQELEGAAADEQPDPRLAERDPRQAGRDPRQAARDPPLPQLTGVAAEEQKDPRLAELGITAELCSRDLWLEFHEHGTEMIITKMGRRMFPTVKVRLHGLLPTDSYIVYMDIVPVDDKRYRYVYHSSEWAVAGPGDTFSCRNLYVHPDSPASGRLWTSQGIVAFDKLKLTNKRLACSPAQISLHSMHKYRPRVHVQWTNDLVTPAEQQIDLKRSLTFSFRETEFITVTAYQNQEITRLKIASNPFAKGFRDVPAAKRHHSPCSDSSSDSSTSQRASKKARPVAPPNSSMWNYSYPLPPAHPPLLCIDPFSPFTLLHSYNLQLQGQQYDKR